MRSGEGYIKDSVEMAPQEYLKILNYSESVLYCFSLEIDGKVGWRLPKESELTWGENTRVWHNGCYNLDYHIRHCVPVRDL